MASSISHAHCSLQLLLRRVSLISHHSSAVVSFEVLFRTTNDTVINVLTDAAYLYIVEEIFVEFNDGLLLFAHIALALHR